MSHKVKSSELSPDSRLQSYVAHGDFIDCFTVSSPMPARQAAEIIVDFPNWAQPLLRLRGLITAPFGLSQDGPDAEDKLGPFPVEYTSDTEVIAGFNDKHLNFRVSVLAHHGQVSLATWVHTHNIGGKCYLAAIMPFHILIARNALARVAKASRPVAA
ncbi:DUF2867 domain-containing protein [uncultured Litoreibacter sp.]|uniref:DUF2867 domain-containing protein n=1 Tax=uncultured Litoreibacter sp. TaxID=1392394 RepID=UPI0026399F43|nr:DUF2867 domain-containing protein [uncultured Litoreibacter sp.]